MMTILNKQEFQEKLKPLEDRFGIKLEMLKNHGFMINEREEKIWIASPECLQQDLQNIKIDTIGLLFARCGALPTEFKPTTNVMQIFGKYATKNILELTEEQKAAFVRGFDFQLIDSQLITISDGFVIVKYNNDIFGVALVQGNRVKNQVPKSRRIKKL